MIQNNSLNLSKEQSAVRCALEDTPVTTSLFADSWPLIITASGKLTSDTSAAIEWAHKYKSVIDEARVRFGALFLRGFALPGTRDFESFMDAFETVDFDYKGGASPRNKAEGKTLEATKAPSDVYIRLHQEMAYLPHYPSALVFYCESPPESGGETILGDMRRLPKELPKRFFDNICSKGIIYKRNFRDRNRSTGSDRVDPLHLSWQDSYYTHTREDVEKECRRIGLKYLWEKNGSVTVAYECSGFAEHKSLKEMVWFNQGHLAHVSPETYGDRYPLMSAIYDEVENPANYDTRYGDGEKMDLGDLAAAQEAFQCIETAVPYQTGDVLFVDNLLAAHGRAPYVGERKVRVMMLK